ncbi:type IV pilus assembly protein PilM [Desulfobulbus sp. F1]|jgi:type IV pilus assembly protein PilM|uniref:Type IV pilus assembly protein PilM n=1 Tax=Candidatus Electronema aureum TaxID=2005002 RepID=A0A521G3K3_9BACT|nr:type IV pilus assembly protein PilM [Desulfobulbus sp. F1]TAA75609.1 MAG: type IV pilus assembly protein PilM [Candidatus Electronema aureum]
MAKKEIPVVGIDIGSHAVKVCQVERVGKNGYQLLALGAAALSPGSVDDGVLQDAGDVAAAISELFKNLKIKNKRVGLSISGYSVIVKKINIEIENEEELDERLHQEAEQYIPFDINEVYLDFQVIKQAKSETERSEVMLVAAKKEVIDNYLEMIEGLKLLPVLVDVDGFALENIWNTIAGSEKNVCLVDIGASKMNINIIAGGASVLARDVVTGSDNLSQEIANTLEIDYEEAEKIKLGRQQAKEEDMEELHGIFTRICTRWVLEIKKAIDLYGNNNPGKPLVSLVLSGGGSKVQGLHEYLAKETGLEVIAFNPFEGMKISKKIDMEYLKVAAPEMSIATGLAIRPAEF